MSTASTNRIVTAFAYQLASNEVKLLGHRQKVDLITMKCCDESIIANHNQDLVGYNRPSISLIFSTGSSIIVLIKYFITHIFMTRIFTDF